MSTERDPTVQNSAISNRERVAIYERLNAKRLEIHNILQNLSTEIKDAQVERGENNGGTGYTTVIGNQHLNSLNELLEQYDTIAEELDIHMKEEANYVEQWQNMNLLERIYHPFRVIFKPFSKIIQWMHQTNGQFQIGDGEFGGRKLLYLRQLIEQMVHITDITLTIEEQLRNPGTNTFNAHKDKIERLISELVNNIDDMMDPKKSTFLDLFPEVTTDGENMKNHWLYDTQDLVNENGEAKIPIVLRIRQIADIRDRVILPYMEGIHNLTLREGEKNTMENTFFNAALPPNVQDYMHHIISGTTTANFKGLAQMQQPDEFDKLDPTNDALLDVVNVDVTGVLKDLGINEGNWNQLEDDIRKKIMMIITATFDNHGLDLSKIWRGEKQLNDDTRKKIKIHLKKNFEKLKSGDPKLHAWMLHVLGPTKEEYNLFDEAGTLSQPASGDVEEEGTFVTVDGNPITFDREAFKTAAGKFNDFQKSRRDKGKMKQWKQRITNARQEEWSNNNAITKITNYLNETPIYGDSNISREYTEPQGMILDEKDNTHDLIDIEFENSIRELDPEAIAKKIFEDAEEEVRNWQETLEGSTGDPIKDLLMKNPTREDLINWYRINIASKIPIKAPPTTSAWGDPNNNEPKKKKKRQRESSNSSISSNDLPKHIPKKKKVEKDTKVEDIEIDDDDDADDDDADDDVVMNDSTNKKDAVVGGAGDDIDNSDFTLFDLVGGKKKKRKKKKTRKRKKSRRSRKKRKGKRRNKTKKRKKRTRKRRKKVKRKKRSRGKK